jgi:hypothetical protein
MERPSRGFREGLRRELGAWRKEGIVTEQAARALEARYDLAAVDSGGPSFLAVYLLGALLVGAGVVSVVAWHWEGMAAAVKLAVIGSAMVAAHVVGFVLWKGTARAPRLGHALAFLGTLVFGANIGLVAQIFHVSGTWYAAYGAFAAGALAAALLYGSLPHHLLAAGLALGVAGAGFAHDHAAPGLAVGYGLAAGFLVVAVRERSRALALVTVAGLAVTLAATILDTRAEDGVLLPLAALACACAAAPLAARGERAEPLAGALRVIGRLGFYAVAYTLSFHELAGEALLPRVDGLLLAAVVPAASAALAAVALGLRRVDVDPLARGEAMLLIGTFVAFFAGHLLRTGDGTALVANASLVFLAVGRIVRGLSSLRRGPFWEGMALASALVTTRFFELDTELWLKGAAFIACGAGVLVAGFLFERRRAHMEVPHGEPL